VHQRFAAGDFHKVDPGSFHFFQHVADRAVLATSKGPFAVAPGTPQVAARKADKNAGQPGEGAFALHGGVDFDHAEAFVGGNGGHGLRAIHSAVD